MADFQVVTHVPADSAHPGGCYLCKLDQRKNLQGELEPMIATQVEINFEGQVVTCASCVLEQAYLLGALPADKADELRADNEAMAAAYQDLQIQLEQAQTANRALLANVHEAAFGVAPDPKPEPKPASAA